MRVRWFAVLCIAVTLTSLTSASWARYGVVDQWGAAGGLGNILNQRMYDLNGRWIRGCFDWDLVEIQDNVYDWALTDDWVSGMDFLGANIFYNFNYTPAWARSGGTHATPPTNPQKYTDFITVVVNRYRNSIKYWGLWNEPNLAQFYSGTMDSYIHNLLLPGIQAIKAADPTAKVVVGELATVGDDVGTLRTILREVVAHGLKDQVDIVCTHAYGNGDTASGRVSHMDAVHNMMVAEGWDDKEFWCTETGLTSSPGGENNQANVVIGMMQGMDARPWWTKTFWYTLTEGSAGGFGLIRPDYSLKPSYTQLQTYIANHPDDAMVISDTIPTTMTAGQQYNVSVTMWNTGTSTWNDRDTWKLGTVGDSDPFYPGVRVYMDQGTVVQPDGQYTFNFTLTAPATPGTYTSDWQMLHEAVRWFGSQRIKKITVTAGATDNAQYISDTIPTQMNPGQQYNVSITMKNTGTSNWTEASVIRLGAIDNSDPFYAPGRVYLAAGETIAPQQQKTFSFTMTAPATTGSYTTDWQMVHEWVRWFGDTLVKNVQVGAATATVNGKAAGVITIDGNSSDWNLAQFMAKSRGGLNETGDYAIVGYDGGTCYYGGYWTGGVLPTSATDHTAKVYCREDATYLYFLVRCDDSDIRYPYAADTNWANDCVEFFIDPSHNHGANPISNSTSDIQLDIDANNQKNVYMTTSAYRTQVLDGVTSAVVRDGSGWWLEVRITKSALDPDLPASGAVGVDFDFRDNDNNNDPTLTTVYSWRDNASGGGFPSKVPDRWGNCVLP